MREPEAYSPEVAAEILERIAEGESLTAICRDEHMPCRMTVVRWKRGERGAPDSFGDDYAQARQDQAEAYFDEVIALSDESATVPTHEKTGAAKLRVDSRKWVLARMDPGKYGDRTALDVGGQRGAAPIQVEHSADTDDLLETLKIVQEVADDGGS